ncbi:unnamed protein product [Rhizophagus irregularis]|uniref:MYND-type domain-containing protein n=1 Tax=Rhizophagus irregularis TaxID=588596 RepID=A0A2N1NFX7_9GLOM|nr:hypothetical protein RhiirC2_848155 [Rhizophagus irregularis]CAB4374529.1 unnamed protein product [Rhizophagus irregularis]
MGSGFSQCFQCVHHLKKPYRPSIITISQNATSLVPDFNSHDNNINLFTSIFISHLLEEAERKLNSLDYDKSINLLLRASQLGSVYASVKLGSIYSSIFSDYNTASVYYFIALKFTLMIPHSSWDIDLILETVYALTKLYNNLLSDPNNLDILNHGIKLMIEIDKNLQDPYIIRIFSYNQNQKRRASRIHINYCLAITSNSRGDLLEALKSFEECELIGQCGIESADKLVKKSYSYMQRLDSTRPKVSPICVQCNYEARDLIDIWNLLICKKCKNVACCGRECLDKHIIISHLGRPC